MSFLQLRTQQQTLRTAFFPLVTTQAASSITSTSVGGNGTLVNAGASAVSARGFVYSSSTLNPTLADSVAIEGGTAIGAFTATISGLSNSTTYYIRAYATNAIGTGYGDVVIATTDAGAGASTYVNSFYGAGGYF